MRIGLLVNPIAGVGASLSWKGTDDTERAWNYIEKGNKCPIWDIVNRAIQSLLSRVEIVITADVLDHIRIPEICTVIEIDGFPPRSNRDDTKIKAVEMMKKSIDLLVFAGGDGTSIDIGEMNLEVPIIGIPGGVKIFSGCFLRRPEELGKCLLNWKGEIKKVQLRDIDEKEYKKGKIKVRYSVSITTPLCDNIQVGKQSFHGANDDECYSMIAERIRDEKLMINKTIMVGAGNTLAGIFSVLGFQISLLGIDIIQNGKVILTDGTLIDILRTHEKNSIDEIWISPIGSQGHIFGRGNRQIPKQIIKEKMKSIRIFSSPKKIRETSTLYSDCGDPEVDTLLKGYYKVIIGYHKSVVRQLI